MEDKDKYMMTELDILSGREKANKEAENLVNELIYGQRRAKKQPGPVSALQTMDELLRKDQERKKDGFSKKIKFKRGLAGPGKTVVIPYIEEEKLIHGEFEPVKSNRNIRLATTSHLTMANSEENQDLGEIIGHGDGEVGDIIGESFIMGESESDKGLKADTEPGAHYEEELYETGKKIMEQYQLPGLKDKGRKIPTDEYIYDLISRNKKTGQILDKKATLKEVLKTNILLGRVDKDNSDLNKIIIAPRDEIYRVFSRERVWKSPAVVFFLRDYSGSMWNEPTRIAVEQHFMIYAWLMVQYEKLVIPRFIVHDTEAEEVTVKEYFRKSVNGGTSIPSGYKKITEIVESEGLSANYNIFVFQATDGEDSDDGTGREAIPEINKILGYVNRMGVCVLQHPYYGQTDRESLYEQYVKRGGFPARKGVFRMHVMPSLNITEERQIEAIKTLIAQD